MTPETALNNINEWFGIEDCESLQSEWQTLKSAVLAQQTTNSARDAITPLVVYAVNTDGCHHKQWYLEAIADALQISLPPHDNGIAP